MARGILKIVFTAEDLARVRIAPRADLTWEMVGSLHRLQAHDGGPIITEWRHQARRQLIDAGLLTQVRTTLIPLAPRARYFPDFLTPIEAQGGPDQAIQALAHTPRARVRDELELLRTHVHLPATLDDLARGNPEAIRRLSRAASDYCRAVLTPHWVFVERALARERAVVLRGLTDGGVEQVLSTLSPHMRWRFPVLEVDYPAGSREIQLGGRGLTLIPSYFCRGTPISLADPALSPVLVYPAPHRSGLAVTSTDALAALLGRTRADVLRCVAMTPGCSTTELAGRAGVPLATASEHARVLRQANLIDSVRQANLVLHYPTELGQDILSDRRSVGPDATLERV
ncbi:winged helix-turn-helix domain-containing protein [Nonomuraea jiangxiensis]|uniref:Helix-turn-helix domain-containing protein n=1 Tax=Nonomuraea jiangxiensis TaxID=633440 RepID=A0A1G8J7P8_9ACTN|nr:helix-turn-helix domain-containing protein [Nonomuraea jiangxiensis]SDI27265.1 Helix-turn-helix domain-containing protein [Nonomuraea jiangxiensis]